MIPSRTRPYLGLIACLAACQSTPAVLGNRIAGAHSDRYCKPDACYNPHILASERGYYITTFAGRTPVRAQVRTPDLPRYLLRLPMTAWPRGPEILISPEDDVIDGVAVQDNLRHAEATCRQMGLRVEVRPGG